MQGPTHLAAGIFIQKIIMKKVQHLRLQQLLVVFLSVLSHGILDKLAMFTYHPPVPLPDDWFWVSYHIIIGFMFILIFFKYWKKYKLGLIFSILPDFDWVVLYSSNFFAFKIPFWKEPLLHRIFFDLLYSLPPFSFLNTFPNWNQKRTAVVFEIIILATLTMAINAIGKIRSEKLDLPVLETNNSISKEKIPSSNWVDKVSIFQTCMDHEQSIRTSYQSLLTTLEVAIFGLFFTLYQLELTGHLWILSVVGITLCVIFGIPCEYRARNVDYWRKEIVKLVSKKDLENFFEGGKYRWIPFGKLGDLGEYLFGHWFERLLLSIILIVWQIPLWVLLSPFTILSFTIEPFIIRSLCIIVICLWIIFIFELIEIKGEIIIEN